MYFLVIYGIFLSKHIGALCQFLLNLVLGEKIDEEMLKKTFIKIKNNRKLINFGKKSCWNRRRSKTGVT